MIFSNELSWIINYEFLTQFILIKNGWMHSYGSDWWYVIGSCTGLVPSGIKPVPQTIFCESYDAIWPYGLNELTHNPPWTKWPPFWQTTFSIGFSWMKMTIFRFKFHWNLFPGVQLIINQNWFRQWLGTEQATSHYLKQWADPVHWRIYAALGGDELNQPAPPNRTKSQ